MFARPLQSHQDRGRRQHREQERDSVDTHPGRQTHGQGQIDSGVSEAQPGETKIAVGALDTRPQRRNGGQRKPLRDHDGCQHCEYGKVQRLDEREQQKGSPTTPTAHTAVHFQHELDPVADSEPEHVSS